jgi:UDP-glucose 4-epimerase
MGRPSRLLPVPAFLMKVLLTLVGRQMLYEQLFGDMVADTSSLLAIGFDYLPGDPQIAAMATAAQKT